MYLFFQGTHKTCFVKQTHNNVVEPSTAIYIAQRKNKREGKQTKYKKIMRFKGCVWYRRKRQINGYAIKEKRK